MKACWIIPSLINVEKFKKSTVLSVINIEKLKNLTCHTFLIKH